LLLPGCISSRLWPQAGSARWTGHVRADRWSMSPLDSERVGSWMKLLGSDQQPSDKRRCCTTVRAALRLFQTGSVAPGPPARSLRQELSGSRRADGLWRSYRRASTTAVFNRYRRASTAVPNRLGRGRGAELTPGSCRGLTRTPDAAAARTPDAAAACRGRGRRVAGHIRLRAQRQPDEAFSSLRRKAQARAAAGLGCRRDSAAERPSEVGYGGLGERISRLAGWRRLRRSLRGVLYTV
jgi:hypothetical protein